MSNILLQIAANEAMRRRQGEPPDPKLGCWSMVVVVLLTLLLLFAMFSTLH